MQRALMLAGLMASLACTGSVNGSHPGDDGVDTPAGPGKSMGPKKMPGDPSTTPGDPSTMPSNPVAPASVSAGVAPLRRLTRDQYLNTIRDLVGVEGVVAPSSLPGDDTINDRFPNNSLSPVQPIDVSRYADAADAVAAKATASLAALVPCASAGDAACAKTFIESFGRRVYRRPLTPDEVAAFQTVYTAGGDFPSGIRLVVTAALQSPKFLYVPELVPAGDAGKVVAVDPWAMASRLSYLFLNTMPDEALFSAAAAGELATTDQIATQAKRLMTDKRFATILSSFHEYWLQLGTLPGTEKDATLFKAWTPELRTALLEETRHFVQYVFTAGDQRLDTLLSAPFSFLSGPLYGHYGVTAPADTTTFQRVDLPKDQRAGLFTQAGLLATLAHENRTSFILRGKMVREAMLCDDPKTPPKDVPDEPPFDPNASAKQRSAAHSQGSCAVCHSLFDPVGFAFEIYDATGAYRTMDGAGPIDSSVTLTETQDLDGKSAKNAVELMRLLSSDEQVRECFAVQLMRFALGRDVPADAAVKGPDAPSLAVARQAFKDGGGKLPALLLAIAQSDAFRYQMVAQ